ncbi:thioredoxin [Bacillus licheniformis]|uniref:thioredoxin n=1 Tax=Bacillus licheniformis TaxID=1402 RepID=UPI0020C834D8|nr:thioredoxin [Bacillus licheniformis]MCP8973209.1 thioredoxin [Bacillus licheniformis]
MIEVSSKEHFHDNIEEGVVLVDVYAPWCNPCKMIAPTLNELEESFQNVKFLKVNADDLPEVAGDLGVMSLPTVLTFVEGEPVDRMVGFLPPETYREQLNKVVNKRTK